VPVSKNSSIFHRLVYPVIAFVLPIVVMAVAYSSADVYPFGAESFLTEDLKYQYIDFYRWFKSVLEGNRSLFYSTALSLGTNTWGLYSYYLASPFNYLVFFFDESHLTEFVYTITALKLACASLAAFLYIRKRFDLNSGLAITMGFSYTFSLWTITQIRNLIWLDVLIWLPIAMYGIYALVSYNSNKLLVITLSLSVISCWYTAYMLFLFSWLFILLELRLASIEDEKRHEVWDVLKKLIALAGAQLLSLLLSSFSFIPTVQAFAGGGSRIGQYVHNGFRQSLTPDFVPGFFLGTWTENLTPQLFCGSLVFLLIILFYISKTIPNQTKLAITIILGGMLSCVWLIPLNFVWNGFSPAAGFYCRMAFLVAFLLVFVACYTLQQIQNKTISRKSIIAADVIFSAIAVCEKFYTEATTGYELAFVLFIASAFSYAIYRHSNSDITSPNLTATASQALWRNSTAVISVMLLIFSSSELTYLSTKVWKTLYQGYPQSKHGTYVSESNRQIAELRAFDDGLYRVEKTYTRCELAALNEGMATGYYQLSSYSSAYNASAVSFLCSLGYSNPGEFSVRYSAPNLLCDALLGVKYISIETCPPGYLDVGLTSTSDGYAFYQNPLALPLGYEVDSSVVNSAAMGVDDPFQAQNAFISSLLGQEIECYKPVDAKLVKSIPGFMQWEMQIPANTIGYAYIMPSRPSSYTPTWLTIDDMVPLEENWRFTHAMHPFVTSTSDSTFTHKVALSSSAQPDEKGAFEDFPIPVKCTFYYLDLEVTKAALLELSEHQFIPSIFKDGYIEGNYNASNAGFLMLSIPNQNGWTLLVNNQRVSTAGIYNNALMLIPVSAGENHIQLSFVSPGFILGSGISVATWITVGLVWFRQSLNKTRI